MRIIWDILHLAAALFVAAPTEPSPCLPEAGLERVCGVPVPEDMVRIPGSPWVIASSMPRDGTPGGLFLIDTRHRRAEPVPLIADGSAFASSAAEAAVVGKCAPPDPAKLITHGLSIGRGVNGMHRLYVVGHGGREAIELFNVDNRGDRPVIRWAGCVPMPEGLEANSVVGLPDEGLMFSSLYDRGDTDWSSRMGKLASAERAGGVYEWHARSGLRQINIPPVSGPNGLAVSEDGKMLFVAGWGDRVVRRLDRRGRETASAIRLNFLPDNLHWAPDGTLLAAGQKITVADLFACVSASKGPAYCAKSWSVARLDPSDMKLLDNWYRPSDVFGDATTAIMIDDRLWLGAISGDCIAVLNPDGDDKPQK